MLTDNYKLTLILKKITIMNIIGIANTTKWISIKVVSNSFLLIVRLLLG
jgi:hypothetical protein